MPAPQSIALSLASHTNAGKTTLARTLLSRDVGEVRDAPHVTEFADAHEMLASSEGDRLTLWDTPGFGDSVRLVRRLRQEGQPLGWFLSQVWDRWRDRGFWASQQALKNVREQADVVLYLVNAAEEPASAAYLAPEMDLLAWVGKPVLVLLNQLGAPRPAAEEAAELERWRGHLAAWPQVRAVLPLDAFARCWVQEGVLLRAVADVLPPEAAPAMARLQTAWGERRLATFEASTQALAQSLARIAATRQPVAGNAGNAAMRERVARLGSSVGALFGRGAGEGAGDAATLAQQALAVALDEEVRASTAALLALHGLQGRAEGEILARVAGQFETQLPVPEGRAALWGGVLSGALAGLKADIASGGLTMGGGLLAGGILGALGAAGLARGINVLRGSGPGWVAWNVEALQPMVDAALLRYLAVAHFGRGRGDWVQGEAPPHWRAVVDQVLAPRRAALTALFEQRAAGTARLADRVAALPRSGFGAARAEAPVDATALAAALQPLLAAAARDALAWLYPAAPWPSAPAGPTDGAGGGPDEGPAEGRAEEAEGRAEGAEVQVDAHATRPFDGRRGGPPAA
jgi:hypothetical protein